MSGNSQYMSERRWIVVTTNELDFQMLIGKLGLDPDRCLRATTYQQVMGLDTRIPCMVFGSVLDHPGRYPALAEVIKQVSQRGHPLFTLARFR